MNRMIAALVGLFLLVDGAAIPARAQVPPAQNSLLRCQNAVRVEGEKYARLYVGAVSSCLQKIATVRIRDNQAQIPVSTAKACIGQLRKILNSEKPEKDLSGKLRDKVAKRCVPDATKGIVHTVGDILGPGATVPQPLQAQNLNGWCGELGGDGSLGSLTEWMDCVIAANQCAARATLLAQYPRILAWLEDVNTVIGSFDSPTGDPERNGDAQDVIDAALRALEGPRVDGVVGLVCGRQCGNGKRDGSEVCEGLNLGGASCVSLEFDSGTLACSDTCTYDTSGCVALPD